MWNNWIDRVEGPNIFTFACVLVSCVVFVFDIVICVCIVCAGVWKNWIGRMRPRCIISRWLTDVDCGCPPSSHVEQPDKSKQIFIGTLQNKNWNHLKATQEMQGLWINKYYGESYKRAKTMKGWMKGFNSRIVSEATITTWGLCSHLKELKQWCINMFIVQHDLSFSALEPIRSGLSLSLSERVISVCNYQFIIGLCTWVHYHQHNKNWPGMTWQLYHFDIDRDSD